MLHNSICYRGLGGLDRPSSAEVVTKHKKGNFETRGHLSELQSLEERKADAIALAASQ